MKQTIKEPANLPEEPGSPALPKKARHKKRIWIISTAALLALAIVLGILFHPGGALGGPVLAAPVYPQTIPYPERDDFADKHGGMNQEGYEAFSEAQDAWEADLEARRALFPSSANQLSPFFQKSTREFLSGSSEENLVYAPLNTYFALGMLAEITDSNSRSQILDLLGADSVESLRSQAEGI